MEPVKPPVPVQVKDLQNFARLALALTDGTPILWRFQNEGKNLLGLFTAYMYWHGDIPILAFTELDANNDSVMKPFLGYRSNGAKGEEVVFLDDPNDTRFKYASTIRVKNAPDAFIKSIQGQFPKLPEPILTEVEDLPSLARILLTLSIREGTAFPLWHFERSGEHILGAIIPFEHYYDSDALPVFFHSKNRDAPTGSFLRYYSTKPQGEQVEYTNSLSDAKSFYAKIISINDMPIVPR